MSTEFLPYVSRVDDQRYQAIVLVHDIPDVGRPRLEREIVGDACASSSAAMQLAAAHAKAMRSNQASKLSGNPTVLAI